MPVSGNLRQGFPAAYGADPIARNMHLNCRIVGGHPRAEEIFPIRGSQQFEGCLSLVGRHHNMTFQILLLNATALYFMVALSLVFAYTRHLVC